MAPDKLKEGMPMKQKITMAVVIILVLVVLWQVKGILGIGGGGSPTITPTSTPQAKPATTNAISASSPNTSSTPMSQPQPSSAVSAAQPAPSSNLQQVSVIKDDLNSQQQQVQAKYINKINELEDLKIQREIAETNQAIATAKLATVTAEKNISDLLTKPAAAPPTVSPGAYAAQLGSPVSAPPISEVPPIVKVTPPPVPEIEYTVISVAMRYGKWNAVIGYEGHLFTVSVGDILPPDNSTVKNISRNSVTLRKNGKIRKVSVVSSI